MNPPLAALSETWVLSIGYGLMLLMMLGFFIGIVVSLVTCAKEEPLPDRILWMIVIIWIPGMGWILYQAVRQRKRRGETKTD